MQTRRLRIPLIIITIFCAFLLVVLIFFSDQLLLKLSTGPDYQGASDEIAVNIYVPAEDMVYDGTSGLDLNESMAATDENGKDISNLISTSVTSGNSAANKLIVYSINEPNYQFATAQRRLILKNYKMPYVSITSEQLSIDFSKIDRLLPYLIEKNKITANDGFGNNITDKIYMEHEDITAVGTYTFTFSVNNDLKDKGEVTKRVAITGNVISTKKEASIVLNPKTISIPTGSYFSPNEYIVSATDAEGNDLMEYVKIDNPVNNEVPGQYQVIYTIIDNQGNDLATSTLVVTVTQ